MSKLSKFIFGLSLFCAFESSCMEAGGAAAIDDVEDQGETGLEKGMAKIHLVLEPKLLINGKLAEEEAEDEDEVFCQAIIKTPQRKISDRFKELIGNSTQVRAAFYNFTLYDVAQAIVDRKPGHKAFARLVVNHHFQKDHCEALKHLVENKVRCYAHKPTASIGSFADLHCKFCLMTNEQGQELLWQGSWNCTGQADENNVEVVTLTNSPEVIATFKKLFEDIKASPNTKQLTVADCSCPAKKVVGEEGSYQYNKTAFSKRRLNRIPDDKMER